MRWGGNGSRSDHLHAVLEGSDLLDGLLSGLSQPNLPHA